MPIFKRNRRLRVFFVCLCMALGTLSAFGVTSFRLHYKVIRESLIVVPVSINDSAPVDFLLDTGTSRTTIDEALVSDLGLPRVGKTTLTAIQGSASTSIFRAESLSMGGAVVFEMHVSARPGIPFKMRGVLGEDFLRHYDILIDNRSRVIEFEPIGLPVGGEAGPSLAATLSGEHLPVRLDGLFQGAPTRNRLTVNASASELGNKEVALQLDSGSSLMMLFHRSEALHRAWGDKMHQAVTLFGDGTSVSTEDGTLTLLHIGSRTVQNVPVSTSAQLMDVDGVLPTSIFNSIFICHSGRFAILDPVRTPDTVQRVATK